MIVLKILLIVLLVILALIALILFFPISYSVAGKSNGSMKLHVDASWLFFLVFLCASYDTVEKKPTVILRILGIPIRLYPKKPKRERIGKKKPDAEGSTPQAPPTEGNTEAGAAGKAAAYSEGKKQTPLERVKAFFQKIADTIRSIPERFRKLNEKRKDFAGKLERIHSELLDPYNKDAIRHLLRELKTILSHVKPRRIRTKLTFSAGDPSLTGELTGVLSLLPVIYQRGNYLYPDFTADQAYLKGTFRVSGHIILCVVVAAMLRLLLDKKFRRLLKHIKAMRG